MKEVNRIRHDNMRRYAVLICILAVCLSLLAGCGRSGSDDITADMTSYEDLNRPDIRIGVLNGGIGLQLVEKLIPEAECMTYNGYVDMLTALESGKVDALVEDSSTMIYHNIQTGGLMRPLDGYLQAFDFGYAFAKNDKGRALCAEMNEFIIKCQEDGTLDEIFDNWMTEDGRGEMKVDYLSLPATNGVIRLATTSTSPPFTYVENNLTIGYDIDVVSRFCEEYGYGLEISSMTFDGIIPAISSGKCDIGGAAICITEERRESVEFSEPYYVGGIAAAVLSDKAAGGESFLEKVKESFVKTFIREDRYKLFIEGIGRTLLIGVLAVLFGTVLGFLIYMACRRGNRIANTVTKVTAALIQGLPVVVILMIFYYVLFASAPVTGTFVSVIVFSLIFASAVYSMIRTSVSAIDSGQIEAAYALGCTDRKALFKVILPQAMQFILPQYKRELVALIKTTAIVGYIAVQDLTRTGDIVRSRTYEAFFPLIAVALIYFALARLLIFMVGRLEVRIDPKRRKRKDILKGAKIND